MNERLVKPIINYKKEIIYMENVLVAQSGGPSSAINATLAGVVEKGLISSKVDKVYGAIYGIQGVIDSNLIDLSSLLNSPKKLNLLTQTPSAALGSCRVKLKNYEDDPDTYARIIQALKKHNIGYFIYIGGNDSMDTVLKLSQYIKKENITDIKIIGAPKTIDNDLCEIDHTPGFGSAAKYISTTFSELGLESKVYDIPNVTIVEIMGRNSGWLTAASALSRRDTNSGPHLIYLCEVEFDILKFISDVRQKLKEKKSVLIAVSEGLKDKDGKYIAETYQSGNTDVFGHKYLAGTAKYLEDIVKNSIGCKVRSIELSLMQRCAGHLASATDLYESRMLGITALDLALEGKTGLMASLNRISNDPYKVDFTGVPIEKIANHEKKIPIDWISPDRTDITNELLEYLKPLIEGEYNTIYSNGIPQYMTLY